MHADFGIVVALPIEREAVLKQLRSYSRVTYAQSDNRTYYRSVFETKAHNRYDIVTTLLPRMGNIDAALATNDMIWLWKPRYVLVIGIAGGVDNTRQRFGDVVVSESI